MGKVVSVGRAVPLNKNNSRWWKVVSVGRAVLEDNNYSQFGKW